VTGIANADLGPLGEVRERTIDDPRGRDSEAITRQPDGRFLVSFEGRHRILRYPAEGSPAVARAAGLVGTPLLLRAVRENGGIEALTALADGRLLMLVESLTEPDARVGFLGVDGRWERIRYPKHPDFKPVEVVELPDGDLLVLERRFDLLGGFQVRLRRVEGETVAPGAMLEGPIIAHFKPPLVVDNYEAMAVRVMPRGDWRLYILSDDNFNPMQRTLLLSFEVPRTLE
jgi:hypothetical protein